MRGRYFGRFRMWLDANDYARPALFCLALLAAGAAATELAGRETWESDRAGHRAAVLEQLATLRSHLEGELNSTLLLINGLAGYVASDYEVSPERFTRLAAAMVKTSRHIRNVGLAPGNILRFVYPREGNERAIGLHYEDNPVQWPAVKKAIDARSTVVAGPVKLVQGGEGLIARTPIFIEPGSGGKTDSAAYWGLASVVIDVPSLFGAAGIAPERGGLRIALRGKDGLGARGGMILGRSDLFASDAVRMGIVIPNGEWEIAARPSAGWRPAGREKLVFRGMGYGLSVFAACALFYFQHSRRRMDRLKTQFLSVISHEIRTPLASVRGSLGLLQSGAVAEKPEQAKELLRIAAGNAERLVRLINDFLDFEKFQSASFAISSKPVDLGEVIGGAVQEMQGLALASGIRVETDVQPLQVMADRDRVLQVVGNLLSNAIKFSEPGSVVRILATGGPGVAQVSVEDEGSGIPAGYETRIFDKYTQVDSTDTRRKGGTGLGLAICKAIVEKHGGRIWVRAREGKGSAFSFTLPKAG